MKGQEPQPPQRVHTAPTASLPHFSSPSGQLRARTSECFIPSHCHILSKKASLLRIAEVMVSFIRGPCFSPQYYKEWIKTLVLAESYTTA